MDYHKIMAEKREEFITNPRQNILNLIKYRESSIIEFTQLTWVKNNPEHLILFKHISKEYSELLRPIFEKLNSKNLLDDNQLIITAQRIQEGITSFVEHSKANNSTNAIRLGRCYASYLELLFNKLKKIVYWHGLNPKGEFMNINKLLQILNKIEQNENMNLQNIKSFISSDLRNSINHEGVVFELPNTIIFNKLDKDKFVEIMRLDIAELKILIAKLTTILGAMQNIDITLISTKLEPLLRLPDDKLTEYMQTGIITREMDEIIKKVQEGKTNGLPTVEDKQ